MRSIFGKSEVSYSEASQRLQPGDPLGFLAMDTPGTGRQEALDQIHSAIHVVLEDVEKAFQLVFDQLNPDVNVADRTILDAKDQIRNEQARARSLADLKVEELQRQIRIRLENLFLQGLIQAPLQEPGVSRWENLSSRIVERNEPPVSEYSYDDLTPDKRGKRLSRWKKETDDWLGIICQNHVAIIIRL